MTKEEKAKKMIENERFHDRNIVPPEEVFGFMNTLKITKENMFLFRKS